MDDGDKYKVTDADYFSNDISGDPEKNEHGGCCEIYMNLDLIRDNELVKNHYRKMMVLQIMMTATTNLKVK